MAKQKEEDQDDGERKKTIIVRWLIDGARYAVAGLVVVLTIAVIGRAIVVSTRSDEPFFRVANGYMSAEPIFNKSSSPSMLRLTIKLRAFNPSGRVSIQYTGVNVSLFYDHSWEAITWFSITDGIKMAPETMQEAHSTANLDVPKEVPLDFVCNISRYGEMKKMSVLLTGNITQISALKFTRGDHFTKYRCFPVTIGVQQFNRSTDEDVQCLHVQE